MARRNLILPSIAVATLLAGATLTHLPAVAQEAKAANALPAPVMAQLIRDERPATALDDEALKDRIEQLRKAMRKPDMKPDIRKDLRNKLIADSEDLNRREAKAREQKAEQRVAQADDGKKKPEAKKAEADKSGISADMRKVIADERPSEKLSKKELEKRLASTREVLGIDGLERDMRLRLMRRNGDDFRTLRRRGSEDEPKAAEKNNKGDTKAETKKAEPKTKPRKEKSADSGRERKTETPSTEEKPRKEQAREQPKAQPREEPKKQAEEKPREQPKPEKRREASQPDHGGQPSGDVGRLLSDRAGSETLSDEQLRGRLEKLRAALGDTSLSPAMRSRLNERLRSDRVTLRARIAADREKRRAERGGDVITRQQRREPRDQARAGAPDIKPSQDGARRGNDSRPLADPRPARDLSTQELRARIASARNVLQREQIPFALRERLLDKVEADNAEMRERNPSADRRPDRRRRANRRGNDHIFVAPDAALNARASVAAAEVPEEVIIEQLSAPPLRNVGPAHSLEEIKQRADLRYAMPAVEVDTINFGFNESFLREEEVEKLETIGLALEGLILQNPDDVFMIEGHTDAVGSQAYNLPLSEQRAEAVKRALVQYFAIRPHNLVTAGYGKKFLKIPTPEEEIENRRVTLRRITPLLN